MLGRKREDQGRHERKFNYHEKINGCYRLRCAIHDVPTPGIYVKFRSSVLALDCDHEQHYIYIYLT